MSEQLEVKRKDCDGQGHRANCSPTVQLASFKQPPGAGFLLSTTCVYKPHLHKNMSRYQTWKRDLVPRPYYAPGDGDGCGKV